MYYKLTLKSEDKIREIDKKKYIDKLVNNKIEKFTKAIGFKSVQGEIIDSAFIKPTVESPGVYIKPNKLLYNGLRPAFGDGEVCYFILKKQIIKHNLKKYTYGTFDLLNRLKNFLEKIFPELYAAIEELEDNPSRTLLEFVRDEFYTQLDDIYTTVEVSINRLLSEEEIKTIHQYLSKISDLKYEIYQHHCQTCYEYTNGEAPYHIELIFN